MTVRRCAACGRLEREPDTTCPGCGYPRPTPPAPPPVPTDATSTYPPAGAWPDSCSGPACDDRPSRWLPVALPLIALVWAFSWGRGFRVFPFVLIALMLRLALRRRRW